MNSNFLLVLLFVGSYFLGAVPFGVMVARSRGVDIFQAGSGNPGATNVWRAVGPAWGGVVFFLDIVKGLLPALAARLVTDHQALWFVVGLAAVLGHSFSPFVGFRGGKGVASALGAALGAAPFVAAASFTLFLLVLIVWRYVSLASMVAAASTVAFALLIPGQSRLLALLFALLAVLVIFRHRGNLARLKNGTESKFYFRSEHSPSAQVSPGDEILDEAVGGRETVGDTEQG